MRKLTIVVAFLVLLVCVGRAANRTEKRQSVSEADVIRKIGKLNLETATAEDVIKLLGQPLDYIWEDKTFTKDNLPDVYIMTYPGEVDFVVAKGGILEHRFSRPGFRYKGRLQVGSSLEDALKVLGKPTETVTGGQIGFRQGVLYRDSEGQKGSGYYHNNGARVFFENDKVAALYVVGGGMSTRGMPGGVAKKLPKPYDDVRFTDLTKLDPAKVKGVAPTLWTHEDTKWPSAVKEYATRMIEEAKNPGLGVRALHKEGVTGRGVNVAIIDQPLCDDHPEFSGKIAAYKNLCTGEGSDSSMHGPAVLSLLAGETIGTAPGARVYFAAAPSWTADAALQAQALDWIIAANEKLPAGNKIRVVSISAAPSGPGSPFTKNNVDWDKAVARAEAAGILVLDCTQNHGIIGACFVDPGSDREDPASYKPGFPGREGSHPGHLLVPTSPRTTAEEYRKGECGYQYTGRGGLSWAIPYAAGVLAMGWQVRPELTKEQMVDLLMKSAHTDAGRKFINPPAFIKMVREFKPSS